MNVEVRDRVQLTNNRATTMNGGVFSCDGDTCNVSIVGSAEESDQQVVFSGNGAYLNGGSIFLSSKHASVMLLHVSFFNNSAADADGGALSLMEHVEGKGSQPLIFRSIKSNI